MSNWVEDDCRDDEDYCEETDDEPYCVPFTDSPVGRELLKQCLMDEHSMNTSEAAALIGKNPTSLVGHAANGSYVYYVADDLAESADGG
jgi:hypothetical protein